MSVLPDSASPSATFSAEVRALMGRHQVTQAQLAEVLGVTPSQMSKRLRGVIPVDINEIVMIADYFGVPVGTLFGELTPTGPGGPEGGGADDETRTRNILLETQSIDAPVLRPDFGAPRDAIAA